MMWRLKPQWQHLTLDDAIRSALLQRTGRYQRAIESDPPATISDIVDDVEDLFEPVPPDPGYSRGYDDGVQDVLTGGHNHGA